MRWSFLSHKKKLFPLTEALEKCLFCTWPSRHLQYFLKNRCTTISKQCYICNCNKIIHSYIFSKIPNQINLINKLLLNVAIYRQAIHKLSNNVLSKQQHLSKEI